jgi:hypothetical protein
MNGTYLQNIFTNAFYTKTKTSNEKNRLKIKVHSIKPSNFDWKNGYGFLNNL